MTKYNIIINSDKLSEEFSIEDEIFKEEFSFKSNILKKDLLIKIFEVKKDFAYHFKLYIQDYQIGYSNIEIMGDLAHIHYFIIEENYRNKGLGKEFYYEIENYIMQNEDILDFSIESEHKALKFWRDLGFIEENEKDIENYAYIPMSKSIEDSFTKIKLIKKNKKITTKKGDKCQSKSLGDELVTYNVTIPSNAEKFIKVPYSPNGFENSCSECSAEMILRYFGVIGWSQFEIHAKGYQTFEGGIAEADYGIKNMFEHEEFCDKNGKKITFHVEEKDNGTIEDLKKLIDKEIPIIVRVFTDIQKRNKHTFVIVGYNNKGVFKHDNDMGMSLFIPNLIFKNQWTKNYFIIYPN